MSMITRRAAIALPAAAAFAVPSFAVTPEMAPVESENSELLRLGGKLASMTDRFRKLDDIRRTIAENWSPRWPKTPEALIGRGNEYDRDLTGHAIMVPPERRMYGEERAQCIATVESLQFGIGLARRILKGRSVDNRKIRGMGRDGWERELADLLRLEAIAARHEAARERIRKLSRYPSVNKEWWAAQDAIAALIAALMAEEARTADGIRIKAEAVAQWAGFIWFMRFSGEWGRALALSVLGPKAS